MADDDLKFQYFTDQLRRGFRKIFETQRGIAQSQIYSQQAYRTDGTRRSRSGQLMAALNSPSYTFAPSGVGVKATVNYPTYLRFLDMKRMGNYRIYNRPIWGILYKETFNNIRYEFREWVQNITNINIQNSFQ